jgi:nucleotide-binding universal stress UspA family protein
MTILVGIDGSEGSKRALEWAAEEAQLRSVRLRVVHAYRTEWVYYPEYAAVRTIVSTTDLENEAKLLMDNAISELGERTKGVDVVTEVVNDANAAHALLERIEPETTMVVIGSRGLGGFGGLLLGSVSQKVAHHAEVPVVIVPPEKA